MWHYCRGQFVGVDIEHGKVVLVLAWWPPSFLPCLSIIFDFSDSLHNRGLAGFLAPKRVHRGGRGDQYLTTARKRAEEALREAHADLEERVRDRTAELIRANESLRREIIERKRAEHELWRVSLTIDDSIGYFSYAFALGVSSSGYKKRTGSLEKSAT